MFYIIPLALMIFLICDGWGDDGILTPGGSFVVWVIMMLLIIFHH